MENPDNKTGNTLQDQDFLSKNSLAADRHELGLLMAKLPGKIPAPGTKEHFYYQQTLQMIESLKRRIIKKQDQMKTLKDNL